MADMSNKFFKTDEIYLVPTKPNICRETLQGVGFLFCYRIKLSTVNLSSLQGKPLLKGDLADAAFTDHDGFILSRNYEQFMNSGGNAHIQEHLKILRY